MNKKLLPTVFLIILFGLTAWANGGDQRIVDGKFYINLSRAPFTPRVGDKTAFLASFVDLQTNKLVTEDLTVKIRISTLGGAGSTKRTFVFEKSDVVVKGGVLEFSYTFNTSGLHEIFFDFAFASNPQKVYEPPDFLLDIQKPEIPVKNSTSILIGIVSALMGGIVGWIMGRKSNRGLYQCRECGFQYTEKEWAEKCETWCKEHHSCNIEIISHGSPPEPKKEN